MSNGSVFKYSTHLSVGTIPQPSGTIASLSGMPVGGFEVMRLSRDGVWVNPDLKPDEVAQAVLNALDYNIKLLVQRAVEAEREACAKVCEDEMEPYCGFDKESYAGCRALTSAAAAIRSRA